MGMALTLTVLTLVREQEGDDLPALQRALLSTAKHPSVATVRMEKLPPSLTAVVELTAAEPKLELAMALTAMRLTVVVEMVVMITFLFSHAHCRALPSIPSYGRGEEGEGSPLPDCRRAVGHRAAASSRWGWR